MKIENICDVVIKEMPKGCKVKKIEVYDAHGMDPGIMVVIKDQSGRTAKGIISMSMKQSLFENQEYGKKTALAIMAGYKALEKLNYKE